MTKRKTKPRTTRKAKAPRKPVEPQTAAETDSPGVGRPTEYRPEYCDIVRRLCEQGATDQEVADILRIHRATLYRWLAEYPEFRDAVKLGKEPADDRVERSLYHRAVGYEHEAVKIMQNNGEPVIVPYREHVPPDAGAAFNWLKNRRPDAWRDRKELTGAGGGPMEVKSTIEFVDAVAQSGAVPT